MMAVSFGPLETAVASPQALVAKLKIANTVVMAIADARAMTVASVPNLAVAEI